MLISDIVVRVNLFIISYKEVIDVLNGHAQSVLEVLVVDRSLEVLVHFTSEHLEIRLIFFVGNGICRLVTLD